MSKFRKPSEAYNNGIYNEKSSVPTISTQETKTKQKNSDKQKVLVKDRKMSMANYDDEVLIPRQRSYSSTSNKVN